MAHLCKGSQEQDWGLLRKHQVTRYPKNQKHEKEAKKSRCWCITPKKHYNNWAVTDISCPNISKRSQTTMFSPFYLSQLLLAKYACGGNVAWRNVKKFKKFSQGGKHCSKWRKSWTWTVLPSISVHWDSFKPLVNIAWTKIVRINTFMFFSFFWYFDIHWGNTYWEKIHIEKISWNNFGRSDLEVWRRWSEQNSVSLK